MAALVAPLIVSAINVSATELRQGEVIVGAISVLLILIGIASGIVALCGIPRHGRKGLLGRGIIGLAMNTAVVAFLVVGLVSGISRSAGREQALSKLEAAANDLRRGVADQYDPKAGLTNDAAHQLDEFKSRIESAAKGATGEDAIVLEVTAASTARLQAAVQKFAEIAKAVQEAKISDIGDLTDRSQIEPRRKMVLEFIAANQQLTKAVSQQGDWVEAELKSRNVPAKNVILFMKGFRASQGSLLPKVAAIRACDEKFGQAMLRLLEIAENNWGKFRLDKQGQKIEFDDDTARADYTAQLRTIQEAGDEQLRLQGELIEIQRRSLAAQGARPSR